jgi:ABC-type dipeptide/oligopeptide/nickel transport system permease subunit
MAVDLAVVIMLEATLSFLGVGVPLTEPSIGMMIAIGKNYIYAGMWWLTLFPGATLILLVVAINLFSDWLRMSSTPSWRAKPNRAGLAGLKRRRCQGLAEDELRLFPWNLD